MCAQLLETELPIHHTLAELCGECEGFEELIELLLEDMEQLRGELDRRARELERQRSRADQLQRILTRQHRETAQQQQEIRVELQTLRAMVEKTMGGIREGEAAKGRLALSREPRPPESRPPEQESRPRD